MKKLKVMTVVGTRPEIIRLSAVIHRLNKSEAIEHVLVHTGQNYDYELNEVFFKDFNLGKPNYYLNSATGNPMETIGNILIKMDPILETEKPDAFLVLGDTNSCLSAIAAKRRHIPIFHMEAGNRCFDQRVPEETNRKIVDHISDINMPYSDIAREYLLAEGFPADRIIKTGSPMKEVIFSKMDQIKDSKILETLGIQKNDYFVVSAHREENINNPKNFHNLMESLNAIAEQFNKPIIFSTHPRTRNMIASSGVSLNPLIRNIKPLGFIDYIHMQMNSFMVLSDSGTINEESAILGFKAINIREAHERPEAMEEGITILSGLTKERIMQSIEVTRTQISRTKRVVDYDIDVVSEKVLTSIMSYVNYVSSRVWMKDR